MKIAIKYIVKSDSKRPFHNIGFNSHFSSNHFMAMSAFTILKATPSDARSVGHLFDQYRQFYDQPADLATATAFIQERMERNESVILYARDPAGKPLGFCQLYPTFCSVAAARIYAFYDLFVLPEFRKAGLGKALMLAAHDEARASGIARMDLSTAKTNVKAQALYESLGWKRDEVFLAYHWEPTGPLASQAAQGKAEAPDNIPSLNVITHKE